GLLHSLERAQNLLMHPVRGILNERDHLPPPDRSLTLSAVGDGTVQVGQDGLPVSDVSFNSTGTFLACAVGLPPHSHPGICTHDGRVVILSTRGGGVLASIDMPTCVTAVAFHPVRTSMLACADTYGQVHLLNLDVPASLSLSISLSIYIS
ncbi:hypothetical protein KIPB_013275, partial [Kipferlia bialata]